MNGGHRTEAHAHGWEFPEVWHQSRVRVRGEALASGFLAERFHLLMGQTTFEPSPGVNARRSMALPIQVIALTSAIFASKEVIEANFPCVRGGSICRDVAPNTFEVLVTSSDHHHCVPSVDAVEAGFEIEVPRIGPLAVWMNGVHVGGVDAVNTNAGILGSANRREEQTSCFFFTDLIANGQN